MIKLKNCAVEKFLQMVEDRKLICFCAGQKLYELCERFHLEEKILYIVDNFKNGHKMHIGSVDVPILSMEQLDERCQIAVCVITSMGFADEIIEQLDSMSICDGAEVYAYELLKEKSASVNWKKDELQIIPKKIHYGWFGGGKLPDHFQKNIDTWYKYCPEYEIIQWNDKNYNVSKIKYTQQAYKYKKWSFVSDYARLDLVDQYGGVFLDVDVQLLKPLDILLQYNFFCGFESATNVAFGLGFGAVQKHPIIRDIMQEYEDLEFIKDDGSLNTTPSPIYQTKVLERWGLKKNGLLQQTEHFLALPTEYFAPVNEFGFGIPTADSFSVHQYAATWYNEEQKARKEKIIRNYQYIQSRIGG